MLPIVVLLVSCANIHFNDATEYFRYIDKPENGLKISKSFTEIELTAKYLPPELKALQELESEFEKETFDSLVSYYSGSYNFLFSIAPVKNSQVDDLNYYDIYSYDEYVERKKVLNYYLEECFILKSGKKEYYPVLFHFEQDYGVSGKLNFHLVFVPSEQIKTRKTEELKLTFNDPIYNTEQTEFIFKKRSLKNIPKLQL